LNPGCLPEWGRENIEAPPPYSIKSAVKLIGAAAIALGAAIGSGEWLLGPAVTAKYGAALLWVATVSIVLQVVLNQELIRYTIATGEPIFTGILRCKPGPLFWGPFLTLFMFLQIGWPGWALSAATAIATARKGSLTTDADRPEVLLWGTLTFVVCIAIIAMGKKVEKTLERAEWFMIAWILGFLVIVALFCCTPATWLKVGGGFLGLGGAPIPERKDWVLLASSAAFAGMGGFGNAALTNWMRDKGWGMARRGGYIPGLVQHGAVEIPRVGQTFPVTEENVGRFQQWMRYVRFEQTWVFGLGCFLGMAFPAMMTVQFVPSGFDAQSNQWAAASYQAEGMRNIFGNLAWTLTLVNGFWILFSTQLGNIDVLARTITDMLWSAHPALRRFAKEDARRLYFGLVIAFALFGVWAIRLAQPLGMIVLSAFVGAFNFVVLATMLLVVQRKFLPKEIRMPAYREAIIGLFVLLFAGATVLGIQSKWEDIRKVLQGLGIG
jgi:hypothetical protein